MKNYVLQDSIQFVSAQYLVKTLNTDSQKLIISSVFRDGSLIKTMNETYNGHLTEEELFLKIQQNHQETKNNITRLFKLAKKFANSDLIGKRILVGRAFMKYQMFEEAAQEFESIVTKARKYSVIYHYLGHCYEQMKRYNKATKFYHEAVKLNQNYADYHFNYGKVLLEAGKCKDAIEEFMRAINLNAYYNQAYYFLALSYLQNAIDKQDFSLAKDVLQKAENYLIKAVQIYPNHNNESFSKGLNALKQGNLETALAHLKQGYLEEKKEKEEEVAQTLAIDFYIKYLSEDDKMNIEYIQDYVEKLKNLITLYPQYADLHYEMGIAKIIMSKVLIFKAISNFETALSINSKFAKADKKRTLLMNEQKGINTLLLNLLEP